jgi:hypothetical protein
MAYIKYTKTATFLFPLLEIPKSIFMCNVKNNFGKTMFKTRFVNAYLGDCKINDYKEGFVFLLLKGFQDPDFDCFYDTMTAFENYVDDYEFGINIVMIYSIPDKYSVDYSLILKGQYSKVSAAAKKRILQNSFFSGKPTTIPLILNKADVLRKGWEKRLGTSLESQEVWSIIVPDEEQICNNILEEKLNNILKPLNIENEKEESQ